MEDFSMYGDHFYLCDGRLKKLHIRNSERLPKCKLAH